LLLGRGQAASVAQLVDAVWGQDPPRAAVETLRTYISRLRKVFGRGDGQMVLESIGEGYRLRLRGDALDLAVFEELAAKAEGERAAGELIGAAAHLREALEMWHGVALSGVPGMFAEQQRDRLAEMRLAVLGTRLDVDLELGRHVDVTAELTALTSEYPLRERFRVQLMLALYRSGRQAEALAVYHDTRRALTEKLGVEPCPALQDLNQRILAADPELAVESIRRAAPALVRTPAQLPADLGDFTGRQAVVDEIRNVLTAGRPGVAVVALGGLGGVGKTTLAVHVAHAVRQHFPDGQLYVDLRGMSEQPADPGRVLAGLLTALGVRESAQPAGLDELAALYRSVLTGRRVLVVLDDARDADQARWLFPGTPGCAVLVTSRRRLSGIPAARAIDLGLLDAQEGVALLAGIVGARRVWDEADAARAVVAACGLLPLAIRIVGARLAARPQWPIAAVAHRLRDDGRRLAEMRSESLTVEATFDLGYRQLDAAQARIFRLLSIPETPSITLAAAAVLTGLDHEVVEPILESLVDLHLIESAGVGRYRYHDLVRVYAQHRAYEVEGLPLRACALGRLVDFNLASARDAHALIEEGSDQPDDTSPTRTRGVELSGAEAARAWLLAEHTNIIATVRQLANDQAADVNQLADLLLMMVRLGVYGIDRQQLEQTASSVADLAQRVANPRADARARYLCGRLLSERHHYDDALRVLEIAVDRAREAGDLRTLERARARQGVAHSKFGRLDVSQQCFEEALKLSRKLGDRQRSAITLGNLARLDLLRGDVAPAMETAQAAVDLAEQVNDRMAVMYTTYLLGRAHLDAGDVSAAARLIGDALARADRLGFQYWAGRFHVFLARTWLAGEQVQAAIEHAERAIGLGRRIADPQLEYEGLMELGRALAGVGERDRAHASWQEAGELATRLAP
jgi:DNA-binding SARP family transcriptional activator/tetratricopeptide (TPR) repeat protein